MTKTISIRLIDVITGFTDRVCQRLFILAQMQSTSLREIAA